MTNKPTYFVSSVDHALRMALLLQQEGPLRSSEIASRLGIARSTTHRILAMLVFRGFAEQDEDRRYDVGSAMRSIEMATANISDLRAVSLPHLQTLREITGETISLQVLSGIQVRYIASVESLHLLKVGDRDGQLFPAWNISGGRLLLAALPQEESEHRLAQITELDQEGMLLLRKSLVAARRHGVAINDQHNRKERGVTAIARPLRGRDGSIQAAVSVAMPTSRFHRDMLPTLKNQIGEIINGIESDLVAAYLDEGI